MVLSALVRHCRSAAPLVAFTATALLAIVLAAQAQLVCSHETIVAMPAISMPGMEMPPASSATNALALCPIVLILAIAAAVLCANALAASVIAAGTARCALALTRRLAVAIAYVFAALAPPVPVPVYARHDLGARTAHRIPALAARRGLRAPPHTVR